MRWLKFTTAGKTSWGIVEGEHVVAVDGDPFGEWQRGTESRCMRGSTGPCAAWARW